MSKGPIRAICQVLRRCRRIVITSHLRPDGDSVCTSLALKMMCRKLGCQAIVVNTDPTPFPFHRLPDTRQIRRGQIYPRQADAVILLECADVARSGQENLDGYFKINIDHHYSNDHYADINWVEPQAPAVGEMAFRLGDKLGLGFSARMAEHLYCAIVSDTGSFQFSNTNASAFEACARLVREGANPIRISDILFNTNTPEKIKLLGLVLSTLRLNSQRNIAVITLFRKHLHDLGLSEVDTEDITTLARSIKDIEVVLFFKEISRGTFRVSIRSRGRAHAASIAEHFGGGGHIHAAGFTIKGRYETLIKNIPVEVESLLVERRAPANP
jgi:phosphoesterase RecJ-like protein